MSAWLAAPFRPVALLLGVVAGSLREHLRLVLLTGAALVCALIAIGLLFTLQRPPIDSVQTGYRGTGMITHSYPRQVAAYLPFNQVDAAMPAVPPSGKPASAVYKNIKVLGDVDSNELLRLMSAMTNWVAPKAGCAFCHSVNNMADDSVYTKQIARRMIQMTRAINGDWREHVGSGGVTCGTCHRGHGIPAGAWTSAPEPSAGLAEVNVGKDRPAPIAGLTSLPYDPLSPFLLGAKQIRVEGTTPLPAGNHRSINETEQTYALMIHFAESLGVGCSFCHNTREFRSWSQGTPHRLVAWNGLLMVRTLNRDFMAPLDTVFPHALLGVTGDSPKVSCLTCHNGAYKPFYGASNLSSYGELAAAPASTGAAR